MKKQAVRMVVYTKDVELITGKSGRTARKLLTRVRKYWGKPPRSLVTVEEFCTYTGFDAEAIVAALQ